MQPIKPVSIDPDALHDMCEELLEHRETIATLLTAIGKLSPSARRELTKHLAGKFPPRES